jgi:hypothetical protein
LYWWKTEIFKSQLVHLGPILSQNNSVDNLPAYGRIWRQDVLSEWLSVANVLKELDQEGCKINSRKLQHKPKLITKKELWKRTIEQGINERRLIKSANKDHEKTKLDMPYSGMPTGKWGLGRHEGENWKQE